MNKAETIRRAMLKYPKATTAEIAQKCGCTLQNVYNVRSKIKMQNEAAGLMDELITPIPVVLPKGDIVIDVENRLHPVAPELQVPPNTAPTYGTNQ